MKSQLKKMYVSYNFRIDTFWMLLCCVVNFIFRGKKAAGANINSKRINRFQKEYLKDDILNFKGVKLPVYKEASLMISYIVYLDTLFVYCKCNDNYDHKIVDQLDLILPEGTYGYINDEINVTVKENDIVIDAGAWIGDFSAYASVKGAQVYAFEPTPETIQYLKKTQTLNKNICIIEKGLGDQSGTLSLSYQPFSGSNKIIFDDSQSINKIEITTIDEFVETNQLSRVDFIKADIEGAERNMLRGAVKTLRQFAPKLAICTYHLPDDPEVLAKIILDANPKYKIVQKKKKLYAMVID